MYPSEPPLYQCTPVHQCSNVPVYQSPAGSCGYNSTTRSTVGCMCDSGGVLISFLLCVQCHLCVSFGFCTTCQAIADCRLWLWLCCAAAYINYMSCCLKHSDKIRPNDRGNNTQGREQNLENTPKGNFHKCTTSKVKIITRGEKYEYSWLHKN